MKSKIDKRSYVVLLDEERFPLKLNRKRTDKALLELSADFGKISNIMKTAYNTDYNLYVFLRDILSDSSTFDFDEGRDWRLEEIFKSIEQTHKELLTNHDEIKSEEEVLTMEDLGFRSFSFRPIMYEKLIDDTDEKEVTEEVFEWEGKLRHRFRTTIWEKVSYGKSSKEIKYKEARITKRLATAYANSKELHKKDKCV